MGDKSEFFTGPIKICVHLLRHRQDTIWQNERVFQQSRTDAFCVMNYYTPIVKTAYANYSILSPFSLYTSGSLARQSKV